MKIARAWLSKKKRGGEERFALPDPEVHDKTSVIKTRYTGMERLSHNLVGGQSTQQSTSKPLSTCIPLIPQL